MMLALKQDLIDKCNEAAEKIKRRFDGCSVYPCRYEHRHRGNASGSAGMQVNLMCKSFSFIRNRI